jgi:hypothetical protein
VVEDEVAVWKYRMRSGYASSSMRTLGLGACGPKLSSISPLKQLVKKNGNGLAAARAVDYVKTRRFSVRRACRLVGLSRSVAQYRPVPRRDTVLRGSSRRERRLSEDNSNESNKIVKCSRNQLLLAEHLGQAEYF